MGILDNSLRCLPFALTYQGTWRTLVENGGFSEQEAKKIEEEYHRLYSVSDQWTEAQLEEASKTGYVNLAFGLRLRTPMLSQIVWGSKSGMPKQLHKEKKTTGNALTQSYGLLNTRAANDFMERVWKSEYRFKIKPIAHIHDACYFIIPNSIQCLKWVNDNLIDAMRWTELEAIQHPLVKLEAELCLYYPTWADEFKIPNDLSFAQLKQHMQRFNNDLSKP
jgi:DNA polymerase-1